MNKNDIIKLKITAVSTEGFGIGRADDGMTVFVPNSAIGDELKVVIVKAFKKYCFGKILEIISESEDRITPDCEVFLQCGGCCYRHINYKAEAEIKTTRVRDAINRIGGIDIPINDCLEAEDVNNYRNKGQYPIGKDKNGNYIAGFYSLHSHRIISCNDCRLQPKEFAEIIQICLEFFATNELSVYDETTGKGLLRHIYLRKSDLENKIVVCIVINGNSIKNQIELVNLLTKKNFVSGVVININKQKTNVILGKEIKVLFGKDYITDSLLGCKFNISPLAFFQVNRKMTEKLYTVAANFAEPEDKTILDLFCGAGTIGLTMANRAKKIIGVEIVPEAIENAKQNAKLNNITNADFYCDSAAGAAKLFANNGIKPDVVILDPPRKGATPDLITTICQEFNPQKIVYVSCDPATLARDLKQFNENSYSVEKVQPVDLFPRTSHVETVVLMTKVQVTK